MVRAISYIAFASLGHRTIDCLIDDKSLPHIIISALPIQYLSGVRTASLCYHVHMEYEWALRVMNMGSIYIHVSLSLPFLRVPDPWNIRLLRVFN